MDARRWPRRILWIGTAALLLGALDPMEGSLVIVAGAGALVVAAHLGQFRARHRLEWGAALVALGVALLWAMSAVGGIGPSTGRSYRWALLLAPYPVGWLLSLSGAIRSLRER
ncbi:MAG: hypothetical protein ACXWZS_09250 [Gemmatirosa sp.]